MAVGSITAMPDFAARRRESRQRSSAQNRNVLLGLLSQQQREREVAKQLLLEEEKLDRRKAYQDAQLQIDRDQLEALKLDRNERLKLSKRELELKEKVAGSSASVARELKAFVGQDAASREFLINKAKDEGRSANFVSTLQKSHKNKAKQEEVLTIERQLESKRRIEEEKREKTRDQEQQINRLERERQIGKNRRIAGKEAIAKLQSQNLKAARTRLEELQNNLEDARDSLGRLQEIPGRFYGVSDRQEQISPPIFEKGKKVSGGHFKKLTKKQFVQKRDARVKKIRHLEAQVTGATAALNEKFNQGAPIALQLHKPPKNVDELEAQVRDLEKRLGKSAAEEWFKRYQHLFTEERNANIPRIP